VAVGPLHLPAAPPRAGVCGGIPGRSLALPGEPRDGAPPEELARAGGARARDCRLRGPARDPDRPGAAVHRVAGGDGVRGGASPPGHPPREEPPAPPADLRQDRALLEDDVGGVSLEDGVRELRGLPAAGGAVRAALQLPASAPGVGGLDARGPLLPLGAAGARGDRVDGERERAASGEPPAPEEALLPGGAARGPGFDDQRERDGPEGARGGRGDDDSTIEGGRT